MKMVSIAVGTILTALTACGKSPAGNQPGGPLNVAGQVVFQFNGGPVSGAKVRVANTAVVTTSSDGMFSAQSVTTPYDVTVVSADGTAAALYVGLTRTDPIIGIRLTGP